MTKPGLVKPSGPANQPCWKTSVRIPNATPTDSRFSADDSSATRAAERQRHHHQGQQQHEPDHARQPARLVRGEVEGLRDVTTHGVLDVPMPANASAPGGRAAAARPRRRGRRTRTYGIGRVSRTVPSVGCGLDRVGTGRSNHGVAAAGRLRAWCSASTPACWSPRRARRRSRWCPRRGTRRRSRAAVCTSGIDARAACRGCASWIFMPSAGAREEQPTTVSETTQRGDRTAYDGRQDAAADPALADPPVEPPQQRHPRPVDPAAELDQQRGQHGDRAEHGDRDHEDRARSRGS